jgi:hypothetical protein
MAGLKFRVLLDSEKDSEVFRDILINDTDTYESFFKAIMKAFRFEGDQMASFYVANDDWDKGHEISLMDMSYEEDSAEETPSVMSDSIMKELIEQPDQKFILVYDFMRMWIFLAELIGYEKEGPEKPECTLSVGMAPPEDSRMVDLEDEENMGGDFSDDEEEDFGFDDFDEGLSEDDYSSFDDYQ